MGNGDIRCRSNIPVVDDMIQSLLVFHLPNKNQ
jgi:hypothetical protein